ncbi:MAG: outer membrane beta-barrel protein [Acidobacteriota bacterium]|nr:outer membrane beta-barrel protein [Acidobacteriota bacterium]MDH3786064.1 outer membrane beta-barrel protein [Acidobacteriota bacterium]
MRAKSIALIGIGMLILAIAGLPVTAGDAERGVRFGLLSSSPSGDSTDAGQTTELDGSTGFFLSFEFPVSPRFGIEPGIEIADHDITVKEMGFPTLDFGETTWTALTVNGNFQLMPEKSYDLYIGPTIGYVMWDDISTSLFPGDVPVDDDFTLGANFGIDVPLGDSSWKFSAALRYLTSDLGIDSGSDIGVDPVQIKLGVARRF